MKQQVKLLEMVSVSGDGGVYEEMREREARRINGNVGDGTGR